jgi:hypothetical protein
VKRSPSIGKGCRLIGEQGLEAGAGHYCLVRSESRIEREALMGVVVVVDAYRDVGNDLERPLTAAILSDGILTMDG